MGGLMCKIAIVHDLSCWQLAPSVQLNTFGDNQWQPSDFLLLLLQGWQGHVDRHILPVPVTSLLSAAVDLVLSFTQCLDVVVSVARKTDASLWPALFSAVGSPAAITELLLETGALSSAACFLIVVDR